MTKREMIDVLPSRRPGWSAREAETAVNALFEGMAEALSRGERIELRGFGIFGVKARDARQGRNPKTGSALAIAAKRVPFFRAGKELRSEINGAAAQTPSRPS